MTGETKAVGCAICGMVHIKYSLLLIKKSSLCIGGTGFFSGYLSGPLPYSQCHIIINNVLCASIKHFLSFHQMTTTIDIFFKNQFSANKL